MRHATQRNGMHLRLATRAAAVGLALAAAAGSSCTSGGGDSADAFCRDAAAIQDDLLNADSADPAAIADNLTRAEPPGDIAEAYDNVLELYESLRDDPAALTDPANATRFADLNDDIIAINDYINQTCQPDQ
jgi:hypothetical protein